MGTVASMLVAHDVYITDWSDARTVPLTNGHFDLDDFTDYLVLVNDRADGKGHWQIVTKAYHANAGRGATPPAKI